MAEKNASKMDRSELRSELLELRKEQFNLRMQRATGQLSNPSRFKTVRRQIARVKTQINGLTEL